MKLAKKWLGAILLSTSCMTLIWGCGNATETSIQLTQETCSLLEGESAQIIAMTDEDTNVLWSSSDESIVSVTDGEVFGKRIGTATITASVGKKKAECIVTVGEDDSQNTYLASKVNGYYMEIGAADSLQTEFVICTKDSEGKVTEKEATNLTYKMYNRGIAMIDDKGVITPLEVGPTTMTVTSGELSCTVDVIVATKLIDTTEDWMEVLNTTDNLEAYYYVTSDLDFEGVKYTGLGSTIEKEAAKCFRGTIDGGNHVVKNITITCATGSHGIFGPLLDAKVRNLSFDNVTLTAGGNIVNGCGLAPSISGYGSVFENVFVDLQYKKKATGNSSILASEIDGAALFEKCLFTVSSPSGNTSRDGIKIAGNFNEGTQAKNLLVLCEGTAPTQLPEGLQIFTDKMEAIWKLNSEKMLGSEWSYSATDLPRLGN